MDETRKRKHSELGDPEPEGQIWYAFVYTWMLSVKSMKTKLLSIEQQRIVIAYRTR